MLSTPYSDANQEFSAKAHELAKVNVYPQLFGTTDLEFAYPGGKTDELSRLYDCGMNVDVITKVSVPLLKGRLPFLLQERFRDKSALGYSDITITEWNPGSNTPSELYKMTAGFFVYGITNGETATTKDRETQREVRVITKHPTQLLRVEVVDVAQLYLALAQRRIRWSRRRNKRSGQPFIALPVQELENAGVIIWSHRKSQRPFGFAV